MEENSNDFRKSILGRAKKFKKFYSDEMGGNKKYTLLKKILKSWEPISFISNKNMYKLNINAPFTFVGFMLSRKCEANCIFCPIPHKADLINKQPFMSIEVVKKVVKELSENNFRGIINYGENGDALLNPYFKNIVEYVNKKLPSAKTILYTNMMHLDENMSEFLLKNNLSNLILNIDGGTESIYKCSKPGINFEVVKNNLHDFINIRNKIGSSCIITIGILSPRRYLEVRKNTTRFNIPYDAQEIIQYWGTYLSHKDSIGEIQWFLNWNNNDYKMRNISCPDDISKEFFYKLFISTEGDTYICCRDYNTNLIYGNIDDHSIYDLWNSSKRHQMISDLIHKRFNRIGKPCIMCNEKFDFIQCYSNYIKHKYLNS